MLKTKRFVLLCPLLLACAMAAGQVPIVDGDGKTIEDLILEKTYVTIVLKDPSARDINLRITGIFESTLNFITLDNDPIAYKLSRIREVRIQESRVASRRSRATEDALSDDDMIIVNRAAERAFGIFKNSKNQEIRMSAALVISASTHENKAGALGYLQELAAGNDVPTSMDATTFLYLAGIPPDPNVLQEGFLSGDRHARATAAMLTGLTNNKTFLPEVRTMLHDPTVQLFPAAAIAIGRMNERSGLPRLYEAMRALTDVKAEAAVFGLSQMGGKDIHEKMLEMLEVSTGLEWFRVLRVLYALDDPGAKELMLTKALTQPAYQRIAALLLAADEVWEGTLFLRNYLEKPQDPNLENLSYKGRVATTLFSAGDIQQKIVLQELVNTRPGQIYARGKTGNEDYKSRTAVEVQLNVLRLIADTGSKDLLSILVAPLEGSDPQVAVMACTAAVAIGNPEFGDRLREMRR